VLKAVVTITDARIKDPDFVGRTLQPMADFAEPVDPAHIFPIVIGNNQKAIEYAERMAQLTGGKVINLDDTNGLEGALVSTIDSAMESYEEQEISFDQGWWIILGIVAMMAIVL
jgi:Mg-chelatase subunit ChlD